MKKKYQYSEQRGLPGGPNEVSAYGQGFVVSSQGQWEYPGMNTAVPTSNGMITMDDVPYPVYGQDETGYGQMMYPGGGEYQFRGNMVYEIPYANIPTLPQHINLNLPQMEPERYAPFINMIGSGSDDAYNMFGYGYVPVANGLGISGNIGRFKQGDWKGTNYGVSANMNIPINRGKSLTKYQKKGEVSTPENPTPLPEITITPDSRRRLKEEEDYTNNRISFIQNKMQDYIKSQGKGWSAFTNLSMSNFPQEVMENYGKEFDYLQNTKAVENLAKQKGWNLEDRASYVDKLTPEQAQLISGSKYGKYLQTDLPTRLKVGLTALGKTVAPGVPLDYNISGLTPKEQEEYRTSPFSSLFEVFSPIDYLGTAPANYAKNRSLSTGSDYAELPSFVSGQRMANVSDADVAALNIANYVDAAGLIKSLPTIGRAVGTGLKSGYNLGKEGMTALSEAAKNVKLPKLTSSTASNVPNFSYPNIRSAYFQGSIDDLQDQANILEEILSNPLGMDHQRHAVIMDAYGALSNEINRRMGASIRAERNIGGRSYGNYTRNVSDAHLMNNQQLQDLEARLSNEIAQLNNNQSQIPRELQSAYDDISDELNTRLHVPEPQELRELENLADADEYIQRFRPKNKVAAVVKDNITDPIYKTLAESFEKKAGTKYKPKLTEAPTSLSKERVKELTEIDRAMSLTPRGYNMTLKDRAEAIYNFVQKTVLPDDAIKHIFGASKDEIIANKGYVNFNNRGFITYGNANTSPYIRNTQQGVRTDNLIGKLRESPLQLARNAKERDAINKFDLGTAEINEARSYGLAPQQKSQFQRSYGNMVLPQPAREYPQQFVPSLSARAFSGPREMLARVTKQLNEGIKRASVGDLTTGSTNTSYNSYLPQMDYIFKNAGKEGLSQPVYLGMEPMNDMGFLSESGLVSNEEIADYINYMLNVTQRKSKSNLGLGRLHAKYDPVRRQVMIPHYALRKIGTNVGTIQKEDGGDMFGPYNPAMNFQDIPDDVLAIMIANNRLK